MEWKMKKILVFVSLALCTLATFGASAAQPINTRCPSKENAKIIAATGSWHDSQNVNWVVDTKGSSNSRILPPNFDGWDKAEGLFQQKGGEAASWYTPNLSCSAGNFTVIGFFPVGPYSSCFLSGVKVKLPEDTYLQCESPSSCVLACS
jgi:hypothetical protein